MGPIRRKYPARLGHCPLRRSKANLYTRAKVWYSFPQQPSSVGPGAKGQKQKSCLTVISHYPISEICLPSLQSWASCMWKPSVQERNLWEHWHGFVELQTKAASLPLGHKRRNIGGHCTTWYGSSQSLRKNWVDSTQRQLEGCETPMFPELPPTAVVSSSSWSMGNHRY